MTENGTFEYGIPDADGVMHREFSLSERTFRHTLAVANSPLVNRDRLVDPVYYDAAIYAQRLAVDGIDQLSPDQVLDLEGVDGDLLAHATMNLDKRRADFRAKQLGRDKTASSPPEAGIAVGGNTGDADSSGPEPAT